MIYRITHIIDGTEYRQAKSHFTSCGAIADEVEQDLSSRYGVMEKTVSDANECMWDPGGMMLVDDEVLRFSLYNITILCKAQHFNEFVMEVNDTQIRGNSIRYAKLHGGWTCICISENEFNLLVKLINNDYFVQLANKAIEKLEQKKALLEEKGVIVRASKDEEGNIVANRRVRKINKDLN